jgi:hypothetical protein
MDHMLLAVAIAVSGVKSLEIDHVPNDISYRAALTPADIAARAILHVQSHNREKVADIVAAIRDTPAHTETNVGDLRYAIRLRDACGTTIAVIYLNAFGTRGVVDGQPVRFADDAIKRAIIAAFPSLYK